MLRHSLIVPILLLLVGDSLRAGDPAGLKIRIEEGDGVTYALGSRATRGITVQVTDETGNPIEGASVNFTLPDSGPSGAFADGSKVQVLPTRADGRASVWGMHWNRTAGPVDVRIVAGKGAARAGTVCTIQLAEAPSASVGSLGGSSHKWLWIGLGAAAAAGAGIGLAMRGGSSAGSCSSTVQLPSNPCSAAPDPLGVTQIGVPSINIGHP